jgi:hypothetical protein
MNKHTELKKSKLYFFFYFCYYCAVYQLTRRVVSRVTRCVFEKVAQNGAQPIFAQNKRLHM